MWGGERVAGMYTLMGEVMSRALPSSDPFPFKNKHSHVIVSAV